MSDLTLPGTIPGLLRRGSPVVATRDAAIPRDAVYAQHALVVGADIDSDAVLVALLNDHRFVWLGPAEVVLDLTDATGRAHAAWWAQGQFDALFADLNRLDPRVKAIIAAARAGEDMAQIDIERLRDFALHVAGVPS